VLKGCLDSILLLIFARLPFVAKKIGLSFCSFFSFQRRLMAYALTGVLIYLSSSASSCSSVFQGSVRS